MYSLRIWLWNILRWGFIPLMVISSLWLPDCHSAHAQSESSSLSRSEQIEQLVQEADASFEKQEFIASYELYRRVLSLDSTHQLARSKMYDIARIYQTLEQIAREEQNDGQAKLLYQQYRGIVRYLLGILTEQLNREFQTYSKLHLMKETGGNIADDMLPVLKNVLNILQELKSIYEQFPREEAGTEKVVERLNAALQKYETELTEYQEKF